jgi:hypothetical protein
MRFLSILTASILTANAAAAQTFPVLNMPGSTINATNSVISIQSAALNMASNILNYVHDPAAPLNAPSITNTQTASGSLTLGYTPPASGTSPILTGANGFTNQGIFVQAIGNMVVNTISAPPGTSSSITGVQTNNAAITANANNITYSVVSGPTGTTYTSPSGTTTTTTSCSPCVMSGVTISAVAVGNYASNGVVAP